MHNDCIAPHLAQVGDTINLKIFSNRVKIDGGTYFKDPKSGYLIQKNRGTPHGGSQWKLFKPGKPPKRILSLNQDGLVTRR